MSVSITDPRLACWAQFFGALDGWRQLPGDHPDKPNRADVAAMVTDLVLETVGEDGIDERVEPLLAVMEQGEEFHGNYGEDGTSKRAAQLIKACNELMLSLGYRAATVHLFQAAARGMPDLDKAVDSPVEAAITDAAGAEGLLRGLMQFHMIVTAGLLDPTFGQLFAADARGQAQGDASIIASRIPRRNRAQPFSIPHGDVREKTVLRAEYISARDGISWISAHRSSLPNHSMTDESRKWWKREVDPARRRMARDVGQKAGLKESLSEEEKHIEADVLHFTPEDLTELERRLSKERWKGS